MTQSKQVPTSLTLNNRTHYLPATITKNDTVVRRGFWRKLWRYIGRIPFAHDLAAAYFCAIDPQTPTRVRAVLLAALAYFILPVDVIPDFIAGLGFTDDATVLATTIALVSAHIKPHHRQAAADALNKPQAEQSGKAG